MKLPEYRTRYRTRRELRARNADDVLPDFRHELSCLDCMSSVELQRFRKRTAKTFHPDRLDANVSTAAKEFMALANVKIDSELKRRR